MGEWCAENVNALLEETNISKDSVQLVSSHGQTVSGHPHWEFGDLSVIAQRLASQQLETFVQLTSLPAVTELHAHVLTIRSC